MIAAPEWQLAITGLINAALLGSMWANLKGKVDKASENIETIKGALGLTNGALVDKPAFVRRHEIEDITKQVEKIKEIIYEPRIGEGLQLERVATCFGSSPTGLGR